MYQFVIACRRFWSLEMALLDPWSTTLPQLFLVQIERKQTEIIQIFGPRRINFSGDNVKSVNEPHLKSPVPMVAFFASEQPEKPRLRT